MSLIIKEYETEVPQFIISFTQLLAILSLIRINSINFHSTRSQALHMSNLMTTFPFLPLRTILIEQRVSKTTIKLPKLSLLGTKSLWPLEITSHNTFFNLLMIHLAIILQETLVYRSKPMNFSSHINLGNQRNESRVKIPKIFTLI